MGSPRLVGKAAGFKTFDHVAPRFIEVRCDNGLPLKAPVEVWIAALMQLLPPDKKTDLFALVGQMTGGGVL